MARKGTFLDRHRGTWRDLNVPGSDGRILHDLVAVWPKLLPGGCFTAHNVSGRGAGRGIAEFLSHLETLPDAETTIDRSSRAGISISFKRRARAKD